jgi:hypothetical protein
MPIRIAIDGYAPHSGESRRRPRTDVDPLSQFGYWRLVGEVLDGKAAAREVRERVRSETGDFTRAHGVKPGLATVLVGDDPASKIYVGSKH